MNSIPARQNSPPFLCLLRARSRMYVDAVRLQRAQLLLTVIVPMIGAISGIIWVETRPWVGVSALAVTICDVSWLDRMQRRKLRTLAKVGEQFDCELLGLPWNAFAVGKRVDPEIVERAARTWPRGDGELMNWYRPEVGATALHLARIVCQQSNLWYDSTLRRTYSTVLLAATATVFGVLFIIGLVLRLSVEDFVVTILAPAAPIVIWAIRDYYRNNDTAAANETIKAEAEVFWDQAVAGLCLEEDCALRSRELQDAIFARRSSSPLLFPFIYARLRPRMVRRLTVGVTELLSQVGGES
jgi:hypothetical protein